MSPSPPETLCVQLSNADQDLSPVHPEGLKGGSNFTMDVKEGFLEFEPLGKVGAFLLLSLSPWLAAQGWDLDDVSTGTGDRARTRVRPSAWALSHTILAR